MVRVYYTSSDRCFLSWISIEFDLWARQLIPMHSDVFLSIFTSIEVGHSTSKDIVQRQLVKIGFQTFFKIKQYKTNAIKTNHIASGIERKHRLRSSVLSG